MCVCVCICHVLQDRWRRAFSAVEDARTFRNFYLTLSLCALDGPYWYNKAAVVDGTHDLRFSSASFRVRVRVPFFFPSRPLSPSQPLHAHSPSVSLFLIRACIPSPVVSCLPPPPSPLSRLASPRVPNAPTLAIALLHPHRVNMASWHHGTNCPISYHFCRLHYSYRQVRRLDREAFVALGGPDLLLQVRGGVRRGGGEGAATVS